MNSSETSFPNHQLLPAMLESPMISEEIHTRLALLGRAASLGSVVEACKQFGVSRSTYYRTKTALTNRGIAGLARLAHRAVARDNKSGTVLDDLIVSVSESRPDWGRIRVSRAVAEQVGFSVSPTRVWRVWKERGLLQPDRGRIEDDPCTDSSDA